MVIDMMQFLNYHFLKFRGLRVSPNLRSHAYKVHWFCVFLANKWPEWRRWVPYCFSIKTKMSIPASFLQCNYSNFKLEILCEDCFVHRLYETRLPGLSWGHILRWSHLDSVSLLDREPCTPNDETIIFAHFFFFQPSNQHTLKVTSAKAISSEYGPCTHQRWRLNQCRQ